LNTGIEGGEHTLFDLINMVVKAVHQTEANVNHLELSIEDGSKLTKIADLEFTDVNDIIRQVQQEFNKLQNETETDFPKALQDAFDMSEKFHTETRDLKEILDKMKVTLRDYENNLLNAKDLTEQAIEKFAVTSRQIDEAAGVQNEAEKLLIEAETQKLPAEEFLNMKRLSKDALVDASVVFDDSLELLNEITMLELNSRLEDIRAYVAGLENFSTEMESDLKMFAANNENFLSEMEKTIDKADEIKLRALEQIDELLIVMEDVIAIRDMGTKALNHKDEIIKSAKAIHKTLQDFSMKVEESHENARRALEKIPEIHSQIAESVQIVGELENKVDENEKIAANAKAKCINAKNEMDEMLKESGGMKMNIDVLADDLDRVFDTIKTAGIDAEKISNEIDRLKKLEAETEVIIDAAQEKIERTNTRGKQVDENVTLSLEGIQSLVEELENFKSIDEKTLNGFGESFLHRK
jgi:methyl-accepting chemotaxis protein